jgi:myo-inositol catabolism protein IolS
MEYRKLGRTDLEVSRVAFGCWAIGGHGYGTVDDAESHRAIRQALDLGVNFFDTADIYGLGRSEAVLGDALGSQRNQVVIATKFGVRWDAAGRTCKDCSPEYLVRAVEGSLRRLRVDAISLYQVHWHDGVTAIPALMDALARLQKEGKILHIGCSNLPIEQTLEACGCGELTSVQLPFAINDRASEGRLRKYHQEHRLATMVYGVLARGFFSGRYLDPFFGDENDTRSRDPNFSGLYPENCRLLSMLQQKGARYGRSCAQIAIRWVLDHPFVTSALVGAKTCAQVADNVEATGWQLAEEDFDDLAGLSDSILSEFRPGR